MFDKSVFVSVPSRVNHTRVTEIRAPTDDSVRLLKEFEDAAREKIVKTIRLDFNRFQVTMQIWHDYALDDTIYLILYDFNGKSNEIKVNIHSRHGPEEVVKRLKEAIINSLSSSILFDCEKELLTVFK